MGKRGPRPKPTALKLVQGTYRPDRAPVNEPRPKAKIPSPPKWLGPDARAEWKRVVKELAAIEMLTELDRTTLALYCDAVEQYLEARDLAAREGLTAVSAKGTDIAHPAVMIRNEAWRRVLKAAAEFGMTPSARTRIDLPAGAGIEAPSDPWSDFARKRRA